jgi:hypothetical protein
VRPCSEADKRVTIELLKAKVPLTNIRAQLQLSKRGLRKIIAYPKHHPENSIPKKSKNAVADPPKTPLVPSGDQEGH